MEDCEPFDLLLISICPRIENLQDLMNDPRNDDTAFNLLTKSVV